MRIIAIMLALSLSFVFASCSKVNDSIDETRKNGPDETIDSKIESSENTTPTEVTDEILNGNPYYNWEVAWSEYYYYNVGESMPVYYVSDSTPADLVPAYLVELKVQGNCRVTNSKGYYREINWDEQRIDGGIRLWRGVSGSAVNGQLSKDGVSEGDVQKGYDYDSRILILCIEDLQPITVTFEEECNYFGYEPLDGENSISYCGTGLREIEITPDKVILRGDVVTETDEDQSELDPSERMHLKADGREIVIEPYIEK